VHSKETLLTLRQPAAADAKISKLLELLSFFIDKVRKIISNFSRFIKIELLLP